MRDEPRSTNITGIALAASSAVVFGTISIFAKLGYEAGASALSLLASRFAIATVLLSLFHLGTRRPIAIGRRNIVRLLLIGGLGYGTEAALFFIALEHAPAGVVGLIFYSFPMWTNLLGIVTGLERFSPRVLVALLLATIGVASIFSVSESGIVGPLLALAAAVAVAIYLLLAQIVMRDIPPSSSALWTGAGAAVTVGIAAVASGWNLPAEALPEAGALGFASAFAFVLLYGAIALIGSARASIANMVEPLTTVLLAWLVLGEEISIRIAIGAAFVVSALPILATAHEREGPGRRRSTASLEP
jgi:drug/metabolite transporter (DMT)-like permease